MHRCEAGNDEICLCGCACARIAQFTSQDQEWLAINDELPSTTFHSDLRQFGGIEGQNTKENESSTQREGARQVIVKSPPSRDYSSLIAFRTIVGPG